MRFHRRVALFATATLFGLLGFAQASNNERSVKPTTKPAFEKGLRERVQNAEIEGCGG